MNPRFGLENRPQIVIGYLPEVMWIKYIWACIYIYIYTGCLFIHVNMYVLYLDIYIYPYIYYYIILYYILILYHIILYHIISYFILYYYILTYSWCSRLFMCFFVYIVFHPPQRKTSDPMGETLDGLVLGSLRHGLQADGKIDEPNKA